MGRGDRSGMLAAGRKAAARTQPSGVTSRAVIGRRRLVHDGGSHSREELWRLRLGEEVSPVVARAHEGHDDLEGLNHVVAEVVTCFMRLCA